MDCGREDEPVREREATREQAARKCDEPGNDALRVLLERRSEEAPELVEDHGQGECEARVETDLDRDHERLGDPEGHGLALVLGQRLIQPVQEMRVEDERDREACCERDQADDETSPKLVEVLDERSLFTVAEPPRQPHSC